VRARDVRGGSTTIEPASKKDDDRTKSSLADPPISDEEASNAKVALCPRHGGMVGQRRERFGMVFYCNTGRQYFRYSKKGVRRPIKYKRKGYA
jgi:hypothetical protein